MWTSPEPIGWIAATILLATLGRQVHTQWRDRTTRGVSHWLFVGQLAASAGFVVYSIMLGNWVFAVTNVLLLATAAVGQWIFLRNRARDDRADLSRAAERRHVVGTHCEAGEAGCPATAYGSRRP